MTQTAVAANQKFDSCRHAGLEAGSVTNKGLE